jgi:hypothetical protein
MGSVTGSGTGGSSMMSSLFRSSSKQTKKQQQQAKHGGGQDEAAREEVGGSETAGLRLQAPAYERVALKKPGIFSDFYLILIMIVIKIFFLIFI